MTSNEPDVLEPTHVRCIEDSTYTEIDPYVGVRDTACEQCQESEAADPYCTEPVALRPCPNGVTAEHWRPGGYLPGVTPCDDDLHEPRTGLHVIVLDR